ncbi:MAG: putative Histidine kinase, contains domain [Betaproteobacteria bacterium]|nr:putative Histidine kinase, contains domain [Betaproteobacteria bacterium]
MAILTRGLPSSPDRRRDRRRQRDLWFERRARQMEAAIGISQSFFEYVSVDQLLEEVLGTALKVVNARAGAILLADTEKKQLAFRYGVKESSKVLLGTAIPWDQGIAGAVFQSGLAELIPDAKQDPRHLNAVDEITGFTTRDMVVLPLKRWEGKPIGVMEVLNKAEGSLDEEDAALLSVVSAFAAMAIEQARLYEEAKLAVVVRLLGDISHDVKNLLLPVTTGADLLEDHIAALFESLPAAKKGVTARNRLLCDQLLAMTRSAAALLQDRMKEIADCVKGLSAPPRFAPCRLVDVVDGVVRTLEALAADRGVALKVDGLAELPQIEADERRLFNGFYNLVNNAIPEVARGGSITISAGVAMLGGMVQVSVADTGRGMPAEIRESLFTAHAISRKPGGTGLGTKIIKDVVDAHRGQIGVESTEGIGTTFTVLLPVQQSGAPAGR